MTIPEYRLRDAIANCEVILLTSYWRCSPDSFQQLEQFTFYGLVIAIPKRAPILGAEIRVGYLGRGLGMGSEPRGMICG